MGCDIHMHVERKTATGFELVAPPDTWNNETMTFAPRTRDFGNDEWFWDRNYALFAWLAGVRNSEKNRPLSEPRGIPLDASAGTREDWADGDGGHSATFFTLAELDAASRTTELRHSGAVEEKQYLQWRRTGEDFPDSWCASTSAQTVPEERYNSGAFNRCGKVLYVECSWKVPVSRSLQRFFMFLDGVRQFCGPDARLVFWFDS